MGHGTAIINQFKWRQQYQGELRHTLFERHFDWIVLTAMGIRRGYCDAEAFEVPNWSPRTRQLYSILRRRRKADLDCWTGQSIEIYQCCARFTKS